MPYDFIAPPNFFDSDFLPPICILSGSTRDLEEFHTPLRPAGAGWGDTTWLQSPSAFYWLKREKRKAAARANQPEPAPPRTRRHGRWILIATGFALVVIGAPILFGLQTGDWPKAAILSLILAVLLGFAVGSYYFLITQRPRRPGIWTEPPAPPPKLRLYLSKTDSRKGFSYLLWICRVLLIGVSAFVPILVDTRKIFHGPYSILVFLPIVFMLLMHWINWQYLLSQSVRARYRHESGRIEIQFPNRCRPVFQAYCIAFARWQAATGLAQDLHYDIDDNWTDDHPQTWDQTT